MRPHAGSRELQNLGLIYGLGVTLAASGGCLSPMPGGTDPTGTDTTQTGTTTPTTGEPTGPGEPTTTPIETTSEPGTDSTTDSPTASTTDPGTSSETGDTTGPAPVCGDANLDEGEQCDDGNRDDTDLCTTACILAVCGDGIVLLGVEECDDANQIDSDACTNACLPAGCGDGIVQEGVEGCDDGNEVDDDECTSACATPACGDGVVQMPDEQCDDADLDDTDECTGMCKLAQCGDGFVHEGVEACDDMLETATCDADCSEVMCGDQVVNSAALETCDDGAATATCDADCSAAECGDGLVNMPAGELCDDGNLVNTDSCVMGCKPAACGDGFVQADVEACDDGNDVDDDACDNQCQKPPMQKIVFVTSTIYASNLGGLAGADAKCQARATAGDLPGVYRAWLSDNTGSPSTRMNKSAVPYVLPNGTKVANNWADLTDGTLLAPINTTELLGPAPVASFCGAGERPVWTNTTISGTQVSATSSCSNWTGGAGSSVWGIATRINSGWTNTCVGGACTGANYVAPLYCVQQ